MKRKNLIYISVLTLIFTAFISCNKEPDLRMPDIPKVVTAYLSASATSENIIDLNNPGDFQAEFTINTLFNDPFQKLSLVVVLNGDYLNQYVLADNITSVPSTITITANDLVSAIPELNSTTDSIGVGDLFNFFVNVTLTNGTVIPGYTIRGDITASAAVRSIIVNKDPNGQVYYTVSVPCPFNIDLFLGAFNCDEAGYAVYPMNFSLDTEHPNRILNDNFWDWAAPGATIYYELSGDPTQVVTIPSQPFTFGDDSEGTVEGSGTYNACDGTMIVDYTVNYGGSDYPTHHEFSPAGK